MNKKVKDAFNKENGGKPAAARDLPVEGPHGNGLTSGRDWDSLMNDYIEKKPTQSEKDRKIAQGMVDTLVEIYPGFHLLGQKQFHLYGYMLHDDESKVYFWQGKADAIAWRDNHYVIVDWKVVDLHDFWEKDARAYGAFLHQCLVYAKLLQLHLGLDSLPYIMIVPINTITGKEIQPFLFKQYPTKSIKAITAFDWSLQKPQASVKIKSDNKKLLRPRLPRGIVSSDKKLSEVFRESATVGDLMKSFESRALKIV